jgi:hypothetical protein
VGRRSKRAMPIQKSEKTRAARRERDSTPRVKEAKRRRGVRERASWIARNDYAGIGS